MDGWIARLATTFRKLALSPVLYFSCFIVVLLLFLDMYVKDIESGICAKDGEPVVEKETGATALVDGKNLLGPVVGNFCMALALKKAKEAGVGWVVAHGEAQDSAPSGFE